jgi:hypothetical protein
MIKNILTQLGNDLIKTRKPSIDGFLVKNMFF